MSSDLQNGPYVAIDFETSAWGGACACAIGMARMENLEITDTFYALIRPPSPRVYFTNIHGLTWKVLKDQPIFREVWPEISAFIDGAHYFIAHNARFDQKVLAACCQANNLSAPTQPFLCTLRGSRKGLKLKSNTLSAVCEHLKIPLNHHHAGSDALACGLIHAHLIRMGLEDSAMLLPPQKQPAVKRKLPE